MTVKTMQEHVLDLARIIVATRDLCGDEPRAIRDYLADNGFARGYPGAAIVAEQARSEADRVWRQSQRNAGVTRPIGPAERAAITRTLENG
jgi:hypothetical protein